MRIAIEEDARGSCPLTEMLAIGKILATFPNDGIIATSTRFHTATIAIEDTIFTGGTLGIGHVLNMAIFKQNVESITSVVGTTAA